MIFVTGATGFIGRHTVQALLNKGHKVTVIFRDLEKLKSMPWADQVDGIMCDLYEDFSPIMNKIKPEDTLIHLAWKGLPNYKKLFHLTDNLPAEIHFLSTLIELGVHHLLVAGTCSEFGMQSGNLEEHMIPISNTPYSMAKDCLRKALTPLVAEKKAILQWVRIFPCYGEGQNPNSVLAALEKAIQNNDEIFNMSGGEQLRDYLSVEEVGRIMTFLVEHPECNGPINCSSGKPISVRNLVEKYCQFKQSKIKLNTGHYPYTDYESLAFWAEPKTLKDAGYIFDEQLFK